MQVPKPTPSPDASKAVPIPVQPYARASLTRQVSKRSNSRPPKYQSKIVVSFLRLVNKEK